MAESEFYLLDDLKRLDKYIKKNSKRTYRYGCLVTGLLVGIGAIDLHLNLKAIKGGVIVGMVSGFLWLGLKYKKQGIEGVRRTQSDVSVALVYLAYFSVGVAGGYYLIQPMLKTFIPGFM
jgi:hypothetical protein